jgi:hypothetical protein
MVNVMFSETLEYLKYSTRLISRRQSYQELVRICSFTSFSQGGTRILRAFHVPQDGAQSVDLLVGSENNREERVKIQIFQATLLAAA